MRCGQAPKDVPSALHGCRTACTLWLGFAKSGPIWARPFISSISSLPSFTHLSCPPYGTSTIPLALLVRRPHALHVEETDVTEVFGRFEGRHGARLLTGLGVALLCFGTSASERKSRSEWSRWRQVE